MQLVYLLVALAVVLVLMVLVPRIGEQCALRVSAGRVTVVRGKLTPALLADFEDIAKRFPEASGTASVKASGGALRLVANGLPDAMAQRMRNVLGVHGKSVVRDAHVGGPRRRG